MTTDKEWNESYTTDTTSVTYKQQENKTSADNEIQGGIILVELPKHKNDKEWSPLEVVDFSLFFQIRSTLGDDYDDLNATLLLKQRLA